MGTSFQILQKKKDLLSKLNILSASAKYDNSCSSSGSKRETPVYGVGSGYLNGIYYTWRSDGRCVSLLKILMTNYCINNCKYCINRRINDVPRAIFTPEEIAYLTVKLYRRNYIEGLFLSSGIYKTPDDTMELMLRAVHILRKKYDFKGYIHLKLIPGASPELIASALKLADRVSSNLELPTEESLKKLAPEKSIPLLLNPLKLIRELYENKEVKAPASTQLIIGATPDSDKVILTLAQRLYTQKMVRRVYYSAYIPVNKDPDLPAIKKPPLLREHRLYQADWLLRFYGFQLDELFQEEENLDLKVDPKLSWAIRNLHFFPVEITKADYWELIRVPGIGPISAKKILQARKYGVLSEKTLKNLGISLKRAKYFITLRGKPLVKFKKDFTYKQIELFYSRATSSL
ncbi:MAG: putative DNA modification/repair radical SAM protein [Thermodesulfobacterium geofontis]|uniref:Putative DNA modification/repair radical SAM protein n=1 Tax=Thermodesulfobacterium geofontis TaxID=1295609 RepID=A0A2N7QFP0_9BACT|nr:MAG: putative DNA modification/repair radical SAM protein [Thermodesulfobacterium geofontis]